MNGARNKWALACLLVAAAALACPGCRGSRRSAVSIQGSTSVQPFAEMLAEEFNRQHPDWAVEVQGGGSAVGLQATREGIADIGMCSRELKDDERPHFTRIVIARDGLAVIVHHSNPIRGLTRRQIQDIFAGRITNWKELGGPDRAIHVITREEGSGTREAFVKMIMTTKGEEVPISPKALNQESNGSVKELVKNDPAAIGYMSLGLVGGEARILTVDGVMPSHETALSGKYPLVRPFLFVTTHPPSKAAREWIQFVLSPRGQAMLEKEGLIAAGAEATAATAAATGTAPATAPAGRQPPRVEETGTNYLLLAALLGLIAAAVVGWRFLTDQARERVVRVALPLVALAGVSGLAVITVFIFKEGLPVMGKAGVGSFLFSSDWRPLKGHFGIFPMIMGSLAVTAGAMVLGGSLGLACAIFLTQFSPPRVVSVMKPSIELLAGIPSVVYGFIGVVVLVPLIRDHLGGPGLSVLASSIVLGVMMLPTVTSISVDALQAVPRSYREGSIAMGATQWQTTRMVMLKAGRSGIVAAMILGMGRAVGETMAVIMVAGNTLEVPHSILDPVRTLTSNIALEMGYASGDHRQALFATGVVLFVIIMILSSVALAVSRRGARRRSA